MTDTPIEQAPVEITVSVDGETRATTLTPGQVFIYAPSANPESPRVQRALERAAAMVQTSIATQDVGVSPGGRPNDQLSPVHVSPAETLVTIDSALPPPLLPAITD